MVNYKRVLPGLSPNQRYIVRVRGVSKFGVYSDWSDAYDFVTPSDSSVPNPPTGLEADFETPDLFMEWTPPSENTDGTRFMDFGHFEIKLMANSIERTYTAVTPFFAFPFQQNQNVFGTAQANITIEVRTVDVSGKASDPLVGIATNSGPLKPQDITGVATIQNVVLTFAPDPSDNDIREYVVERSMTGSPASFVEIGRSEGNGYIDQTGSEADTYYYRYKVVDYFNQESPYSNIFSIESEPVPGFDQTPPQAVQDFTLVGSGIEPSTHRAYVDVEWTPNTVDDDLANYELRILRVSDSRLTTVMLSPDASSHRAENLAPNTEYQLSMYAYDYNGNRSAISTTLTTTTPADDSPPDTPTNYGTIPGNRVITVHWDPVDHIQLSHYEVYTSTTQGFTPGIANRVFYGNSTRFLHHTGDNETWYFRLRAVNNNGQASAYTSEFSGTSNDTFTRDTAPPAEPTGISATSGEELFGQTSAVYAEVSWLPVADSDLAGYSVRIRRSTETNYEYMDVPKGVNSVKFTRILADVEYAVQVAAYDLSGNYSAYAPDPAYTFYSAKDNDAPAIPLNAISSTTLRNIAWRWDAVEADDLAYYEAQVDDTDGNFNSIVQTFKGLATGFTFVATNIQTYYMRVRAVDVSGNMSGWSNTATGTASEIEGVDIDTQAPLVPSGLALDTGLEFTGAKESVYVNASWTQNTEGDLAGYSVRLRKAGETRYEFRDVLAGNGSVKFVGLEPNAEYRVSIAAYDGFGNYSVYSDPEVAILAAKDNIAPSVPSSLTGSVSLRSIQWGWADVGADDLAYYYAEVDDTDSNFNSIVDTYKGTSNSFTFVGDNIQTYYMRVKAVDLSGNDSGFATPISATTTSVEGVDLDVQPPATPSGVEAVSGQEFNGQTENVYLVVSWLANGEADLSGYNVRIKRSSDSVYQYSTVEAPETTAKFTGLAPNTSYDVQVSAFDSLGNYSPYSTAISATTSQDNSAPPAPANLILSPGIRSIVAQWGGVNASDLKHYNVYIADGLGNNQALHSESSSTLESITRYWDGAAWQDLAPEESYTVTITAEDHSGNESGTVSGVVDAGQVGQYDIAYQAVKDSHIESLRAGAITTDFLTAVITVSGSIKTAESGARMEMNDQGLIGYDVDGATENFRYDNTTGDLTLVGPIVSGGSITGTEFTGGIFQTNSDVTANPGGGIRIDETNGFRAYLNGVPQTRIDPDGYARFQNVDILTTDPTDFSLVIGSASSILTIDSQGLYMGSGTFGSATFSVDYQGDVIADSIQLGSGAITGEFTINGAQSRLIVGSGTDSGSRLTMDESFTRAYDAGNNVTFEISHSDGSVTIADGSLTAVDIDASSTITGATIVGAAFKTNSNPQANPGSGIQIDNTDGFRAYRDGVPISKIDLDGSATFNDVTIYSSIPAPGEPFLTVGSSSSVFKVDQSGISLGSNTFSSAPFRATYTGHVTAEDIDLKGGTVTGPFNITGSGKLRVGSTTDSGQRIVVDASSIRAWNSGGTETFTLTTSGVTIRSGTLTSPSITAGTFTLDTGGVFQTNTTPTTNGIIINYNDGFRAFNSGSLNAQITRTGSATFNDILITGAGKAADELVINTGNFKVQADGDVEASNITATGGLIGGTAIIDDNGTPKLDGGIIQGADFLVNSNGKIEFQESGKIVWDPLADGGIELSGKGYMNNSTYRAWKTAGFPDNEEAGWHIDETGIYLYDGLIKAEAVEIGVSTTNLVQNGSFGPPAGVEPVNPLATPLVYNTQADKWSIGGSATKTVVSGGVSLFQNVSQRLQATAAGNLTLSQTVYATGGGAFRAGDPVSFSFWVRQEAGSARVADIYVTGSDSSIVLNLANETLTLGAWKRISGTVTLPSDLAHLVIQLRILSAQSGDDFYIDGAKVERSSFPTDFSPAPLDIPNNYIQDAYIQSLNAGKITSSSLFTAEIGVSGDGRIYSNSYGGDGVLESGYQLTSTGARFLNGGIEIIGAGGADTSNGYVTLDSDSLRLMYDDGLGGGLTTKFKVDQSGVYIGGADTATADVYFNGDKTVFTSGDTGFNLTIDTSPEPTVDPLTADDATPQFNNKIISLQDGSGDYRFYLGTLGEAYFAGGIINDSGFQYGHIEGSRMTIGSPFDDAPADSILVQNGGDIFINGGGMVIGSQDPLLNIDNQIRMMSMGSSTSEVRLGRDVLNGSSSNVWNGFSVGGNSDVNNFWGTSESNGAIYFYVGDSTDYVRYSNGNLNIETPQFSVSGSTATFSGLINGGTINIGNGNFTVDSSGKATMATSGGTISTGSTTISGMMQFGISGDNRAGYINFVNSADNPGLQIFGPRIVGGNSSRGNIGIYHNGGSSTEVRIGASRLYFAGSSAEINGATFDLYSDAMNMFASPTVHGTLTATATILSGGVGGGSAGVPAYRFEADGNSGMYSISNGAVGLSTNGGTRLRVDGGGTTLYGGFLVDSTSGNNAELMRVNRSGGVMMLQLVARDGGTYNTQIRGYSNSYNVKLQGPGVASRNYNDSSYGPMQASSFTISSDPLHKKDVARFTDPWSVIGDAPTYRYHLKNSKDQNRHVSVMTSDLPDWLVTSDQFGNEGINQQSLIAILWEAVRDLNRRLLKAEGIDSNNSEVERRKVEIAERLEARRNGDLHPFPFETLSDEAWDTDKKISEVRRISLKNREKVSAKKRFVGHTIKRSVDDDQ